MIKDCEYVCDYYGIEHYRNRPTGTELVLKLEKEHPVLVGENWGSLINTLLDELYECFIWIS